jgi:leucyl/phenylalanyl-tRNA---protein transferase
MRYPDWESLEIAPAAPDGLGRGGLGPGGLPVAFCADLSPASVLGAYRRGVIPMPAPDEHFRTVNEFRYEDLVADGTIGLVGAETADPYWVAWWSPDPRPVIRDVHLGRNVRGRLRRDDLRTTANLAFDRVAEACRAGREPRWLTDPLLAALTALHAEGWAHSIEVWRDGELAGGAIGIGIGGVISGDSLFGWRPGAAAIAVADMAARLEAAGGLLIDAQWDSPFLRSLGAEPMPRSRYLPLLAGSAERIALPGEPLPARRLLLSAR